MKKHIILKIVLALLPALIFAQNYAWITLNVKLGLAFLIIWGVMIWSVLQLMDRNHILERLFRLTEISFFMLPISAIVFTFIFGSRAITLSGGGLEQAGATLGTAIGGTFIVVLSFIIGLTGGIIMHLIAGKYEKKAEASEIKQQETLSNKHGIILSLVAVMVLAIIMSLISSTQHAVNVAREKGDLRDSLQQGSVAQTVTIKEGARKVILEITNKDFYEADWRSGSYQDQILMGFKFSNETEKDMRGFEGVLTFYDIFDNKISATKISYDEGLPMRESKVWEAGMNYNQFMDEDVKLKNTELKNLKYRWEVETIIYADDSRETF